MGKYASNAHVLGTCIKYCTNASPLGDGRTYMWRPNITGTIGGVLNTGASVPYYGNGYSYSLAGGGLGTVQLYSDFSLSNSIYTDSGKVYPASVAVNYIIKC